MQWDHSWMFNSLPQCIRFPPDMMAYHREPVADRVPETDHMLTAAGMRRVFAFMDRSSLFAGGLLELGVPRLTRDRLRMTEAPPDQGWTNKCQYIHMKLTGGWNSGNMASSHEKPSHAQICFVTHEINQNYSPIAVFCLTNELHMTLKKFIMKDLMKWMMDCMQNC